MQGSTGDKQTTNTATGWHGGGDSIIQKQCRISSLLHGMNERWMVDICFLCIHLSGGHPFKNPDSYCIFKFLCHIILNVHWQHKYCIAIQYSLYMFLDVFFVSVFCEYIQFYYLLKQHHFEIKIKIIIIIIITDITDILFLNFHCFYIGLK